jgi:hypothetical protein
LAGEDAMAEHDIERFKAMVDAYRRLTGQREHARLEQHARFTAFCEGGRALIGRRLEGWAVELRRWRERFGERLPAFDLFEALGIAGKENRYTDLLAWLCQRREGAGGAFVQALLARAQPAALLPVTRGALLSAGREVVTDDGRIDLVIEFEHAAIALEVKVWSEEHDTPGARPQSVSYTEALARKLTLAGRSKRVVSVLLSPAGTPPSGADAARLSFLDVADAALTVAARLPTEEERAVVRLFAAHCLELAGHAVAGTSFSFRETVEAMALPREKWPRWVLGQSSRLAMFAALMEVHPR